MRHSATDQERRLESWMEWKQRCALGLCSEAASSILREFAAARFRRFLRAYSFQTNISDVSERIEAPADCWHLFETHLALKASPAGKRYKDWLFARVETSDDSPVDVIQGGATLLLRDVVREYLRREYSPPNMVSLNQPCGDAASSLTLEDLLPGQTDPASETERREFERIARERAPGFFSEMDDRERVAVLARAIGLALAHPAVQETAGCGKSMVHSAYSEAIQRMCSRLRSDYADDDREAVCMLALMTVRELEKTAMDWGKSENRCDQLFRCVEGK